MIDEATKNGDDTSWLSDMGGDVQVDDEDQNGFSKALNLGRELSGESSKRMTDEIEHLNKAIKLLEQTQKNLKEFSDGQFDAKYADRVDTQHLEVLAQKWLDITKGYYGEDDEEK
ncbi:hypothetical protein NW755_011513 [Fusarium falciforme]|uniref:Uncharacterized protein n=1 Tax=Fusarium falciforme TaxID=195108 RepID=A0A9W8UWX2_9HYPO|nr:hypothetical protein NW755_011513 [Fusarium falciforme]